MIRSNRLLHSMYIVEWEDNENQSSNKQKISKKFHLLCDFFVNKRKFESSTRKLDPMYVSSTRPFTLSTYVVSIAESAVNRL